jgi:hypothetical protein
MNRLLLGLLLGCLSWTAYGQVLPNGKTISNHAAHRTHNNTTKQPTTKKPKGLTRPYPIWNNYFNPSVLQTSLEEAPENYQKILRSTPCWSVEYFVFRVPSEGRSYQIVKPQDKMLSETAKTLNKDLFQIVEFVAKGARIYYIQDSTESNNSRGPIFVSELVPYDKVEILGCNKGGEYAMSAILNDGEWNILLKIKPSSREMLRKLKMLVKTPNNKSVK